VIVTLLSIPMAISSQPYSRIVSVAHR
jgi:hypothetical protein